MPEHAKPQQLQLQQPSGMDATPEDTSRATLSQTALLHLLQLASPSLPIGAYSYSQGLESALENGLVRDAASARGWIVQMLHEVVARFEMPVLWRLLHAFEQRDGAAVARWTERFLASRDSAEFRAETIQMGYSLARLASELALADAGLLALLTQQAEIPLPCAYAYTAVAMGVPAPAALLGMLFGWAENQVLVCVKSVPLGQVAGQKLLLSLRPELELAAATAQRLADAELSSWAPGLSLLSMLHETQYSRLYRS